jgi:hypothetical protein
MRSTSPTELGRRVVGFPDEVAVGVKEGLIVELVGSGLGWVVGNIVLGVEVGE